MVTQALRSQTLRISGAASVVCNDLLDAFALNKATVDIA
jgi:hypothetical protein